MQSGTQELAAMNFPQRLKCAMKGTREQRAILIRDPNKMICASVLSCPKVSTPEIESFARMQNVSEDVLRIIGSNRAWLKSYGVVLALTKNPKTPLALSMGLLSQTAGSRRRQSVGRPERAGSAAHLRAQEGRRERFGQRLALPSVALGTLASDF